MLETVLRAVHARASELNVTHWELFTLRDADSAKDDLFHSFGVLHQQLDLYLAIRGPMTVRRSSGTPRRSAAASN